MTSAGKRLSQYRRAAGLTQEDLADRLGVDRTTVGRWERGTSAPRLYLHALLAETLNVPMAKLRLTPNPDDVRESLVFDHVASPAFTTPSADPNLRQLELAAGLSMFSANEEEAYELAENKTRMLVGADHIRLIERALSRIEHYDATSGAGKLFSRAISLYTLTIHWIRDGIYPSLIGRQLQRLHGDLAAWCSWLALDTGNHACSLRILRETLIHARIHDYPDLEVHCMIILSQPPAFLEPRGCLQTALAAERISAAWATPRLRSLLHLRFAQAHASMGDERATKCELAKARTKLEKGHHQDDPLYIQFMNHSEIDGLEGWSYLTLGNHRRASAAFRKVTENPDPAYRRNIAYYTAYLSEAMANERDFDNASETGIRALNLNQEVDSTRTKDTLRRIRKKLDYLGRPSAKSREFIDAYDEGFAA